MLAASYVEAAQRSRLDVWEATWKHLWCPGPKEQIAALLRQANSARRCLVCVRASLVVSQAEPSPVSTRHRHRSRAVCHPQRRGPPRARPSARHRGLEAGNGGRRSSGSMSCLWTKQGGYLESRTAGGHFPSSHQRDWIWSRLSHRSALAAVTLRRRIWKAPVWEQMAISWPPWAAALEPGGSHHTGYWMATLRVGLPMPRGTPSTESAPPAEVIQVEVEQGTERGRRALAKRLQIEIQGMQALVKWSATLVRRLDHWLATCSHHPPHLQL